MPLITAPTEWQEKRLILAPENINLAVFGGRGAGRTTGAMFCAVKHCELHGYGARVLFIRQIMKSMRELEDLFQLMLSSAYGKSFRVNRQEHVFTFPNGATVEFAPLNDTEDMSKVQGRNFSLVIADEFGNFSPMQMNFVDQLRASLRAGLIPTRYILLANPGGRGHGAIKAKFIDKLKVPYVTGILDDGLEWVWCAANYTDNPNNPEDYDKALYAAAHKDKELYRAWTRGDWNIARGAMFADCIDERYHLLEPTSVKLEEAIGWRPGSGHHPSIASFTATDWGQSSPSVSFACNRILAPIGPFPRGSLLLLDEVSSADPEDYSAGLNWSIGRLADAMGDMCERNHCYKTGVIDDARGLAPDDTLIKGMQKYQFNLKRPMKNRRSGWAALRELLTNTITNAQKNEHKPALWISQKCKGWWDTVPLMPRDPLHPEDVDTKSIDHWGDTSRYAAVYEPGIVRVNSAADTVKNFGIGGPTAPKYC